MRKITFSLCAATLLLAACSGPRQSAAEPAPQSSAHRSAVASPPSGATAAQPGAAATSAGAGPIAGDDALKQSLQAQGLGNIGSPSAVTDLAHQVCQLLQAHKGFNVVSDQLKAGGLTPT